MTDIEELEQLFFKVISDLEEFLPYLVIVGGWVPYLFVKDIYYVYYVLRFHPKKESLFTDLKTLSLHEEKESVVANLGSLFSRVSSEGCLMVEQENGPDNYISDVRKDALERFNELIDTLSY